MAHSLGGHVLLLNLLFRCYAELGRKYWLNGGTTQMSIGDWCTHDSIIMHLLLHVLGKIQIDWLVGLLIDWLVDWLIGWLIDWLNDWLVDLLVGWLNDSWLFDCLIDLFIGRLLLVGWLIHWLIDLLNGWLFIEWLVAIISSLIKSFRYRRMRHQHSNT